MHKEIYFATRCSTILTAVLGFIQFLIGPISMIFDVVLITFFVVSVVLLFVNFIDRPNKVVDKVNIIFPNDEINVNLLWYILYKCRQRKFFKPFSFTMLQTSSYYKTSPIDIYKKLQDYPLPLQVVNSAEYQFLFSEKWVNIDNTFLGFSKRVDLVISGQLHSDFDMSDLDNLDFDIVPQQLRYLMYNKLIIRINNLPK